MIATSASRIDQQLEECTGAAENTHPIAVIRDSMPAYLLAVP